MRVYVAPIGLWLTPDAGEFESAEFNSLNGRVRVGLAPATPFTPIARLRIEQPASLHGVERYEPAAPLKFERDAFEVPLSTHLTRVEVIQR